MTVVDVFKKKNGKDFIDVETQTFYNNTALANFLAKSIADPDIKRVKIKFLDKK